MENFEKLIELIFKKKDSLENSFLIISGRIPNVFKKFLISFVSLVPRCKIICCLKKGDFCDLEVIVKSEASVVMIASYNKKKKSSEIMLKQRQNEMMIKFQILNLTQNSSKIFFGNFNKNSRPLVLFDTIFKERPDLNVFRKLILSFFKSKLTQPNLLPSFDHIISFFYIRSKIFLRIYQICNNKKNQANKKIKNQFCFVEIGPRFRARINKFTI
jgi:hypothetical protein